MAIKIKTMIEIAGQPKEHVEKVIKKIAEGLKEKFKVNQLEIPETIEKNKIWGTFIDAEMEFNKIKDITDFSINFMPTSIEIIEPENINIDSLEMQDFLNDILHNLHKFNMVINKLTLEKKHLNIKLTNASAQQ